jgi:outer membrane immunogenic protein
MRYKDLTVIEDEFMKTLIISTAIATLAAFSSAYAADAVIEAPPAPPVADVVPAFTWAGGYVGALGGGVWVNGDFEVPGASASQDFNGGFIGGFAGYNFQHDNIVFGVEGDIDYNWNKESIGGVDVGTDLSGSVRGRVGYAMDRALIYATAGWAATRGYIDDGDKETKTFNGWTVGGGIDYAFTNNIFGRAEYRYTDFSDKDIDGINVDLKQNAVMVGIGVKF